MKDLDSILDERSKTHGNFFDNSAYCQYLKEVFSNYDIVRGNFEAYQLEAIDMIFHKIARILSGNPDEIDHWQDIAGYALLVVKELQKGESKDGLQEKEKEVNYGYVNP